MKRIMALTLCLLTLLSGCSKPAVNTEIDGSVSKTAMEVADGMNLGINLGNTFEAYASSNCESIEYTWIPTIGDNTPKDYETAWGTTYTTQEAVDGMKQAGFDTLRIPVFWGNMMEDDGTWTVNEDYLARVKEVVGYAQKAGMYSVVNIHHFDEFIIRRNDVDKCVEIFTRIWTQIAEYFKDCDYTVVFEGFNEYLGGKQFDENGELRELSDFKGYLLTNKCNQAFVDAVRATGGNNAERVLIVSGYWTNIDKTSSSEFIMPADTVEDRLMVSVHYVDNNMYWSNSIGNQRWLDYIEDQCNKLDAAFTSKGIPVFMGETTASYPIERLAGDAKFKDSAECVEIVLDELTDRGFVPVIWTCYDDWYDRANCKMAEDDYAKVVEKIANKVR